MYIMDNSKYYNSDYKSIDDEQIQQIRKNYKVIDVDWLDSTLLNSQMFADEYFIKRPEKRKL